MTRSNDYMAALDVSTKGLADSPETSMQSRDEMLFGGSAPEKVLNCVLMYPPLLSF